jgi:hypothetical protein
MSRLHAAFGGLSSTLLAMATAMAAEPATLTDQLAELQRQNAELGQRLGALEQRAAQAPRSEAGPLRLIDLSLNVLMCAGGSTATDAEISDLQGGGHDPQRRGFTFQGAELSFAGAVDPYFTAEMHVVFAREEPSGETIIELEEAFARSSSLPYGLELKAGQYLTEFGRFNPTHPHSWAFIDQPIILGRVFGGDGQRAPGARMLGSLPTPWMSELILNTQNADGENSSAFLGAPDEGGGGHDHGGAVGGYHPVERDNGPHLLYSARWVNAWDIDDTMVKCGASAATGPNAGGENTSTSIWGADLAAKWKPSGGKRGWPFVIAEAEFIERRYGVDVIDATGSGLDGTLGTGDDTFSSAPAGTLVDRGIVLQTVWGFHPGWSAGLRYEFATGTGDSIHIEEDAAGGEEIHLEDRQADPNRCDRQRWSPMLAWQPSEFTHFRLQYNYDRSDAMADPAHSVWLGAEFLIGAHPAHTF